MTADATIRCIIGRVQHASVCTSASEVNCWSSHDIASQQHSTHNQCQYWRCTTASVKCSAVFTLQRDNCNNAEQQQAVSSVSLLATTAVPPPCRPLTCGGTAPSQSSQQARKSHSEYQIALTEQMTRWAAALQAFVFPVLPDPFFILHHGYGRVWVVREKNSHRPCVAAHIPYK